MQSNLVYDAIDLFSHLCKLPISDHVMLSEEHFLKDLFIYLHNDLLEIERNSSQGYHHAVGNVRTNNGS